ncbi:DUF742 domain-containing protein, partial [Streptomyces sp. NPDC088246]|uniref:DUF742 domain-containing protein n=1 Tax=Streptomyces sp. NPDC088246 TaxID=3365842 RepID=UPI0037FFE502
PSWPPGPAPARYAANPHQPPNPTTGPNKALLGPEHRALLTLCRSENQSVAELSADADLPVGVVRVLLGDLLEAGYVRVSRPVPPAQLPDEHILREVINGLRAL